MVPELETKIGIEDFEPKIMAIGFYAALENNFVKCFQKFILRYFKQN